MKLPLTLLFILSGFWCMAQKIEGSIFDKDTRNTLQDVTVINKKTGNVVNSDKQGRFVAYGSAGDTLLFYHSSYLPAFLIIPYTMGNMYRSIFMEHLNYKLKEATITGKSKYEQDSLYMREAFQHSIDYNQPVKLKFHYWPVLAVQGLFSAVAERLLGQTKKKKKFLKTFADNEHSKFVDSRYSVELVSALTNLPHDSAASFMNATPMPYDFSRTATDLELKMWIRYNYRQWMNKIKDSAAHHS